MKNAISFVLVLLMIFMLIGCSSVYEEEKTIVVNNPVGNAASVAVEKEETQEDLLLYEEIEYAEDDYNKDGLNGIPNAWPDQIPEDIREQWEGNISLSSILVVLTFEESMKLKDYTADDFAEIGCTYVNNLSKATVNIIKNAEPGTKEAEGIVGLGEFHCALGIHFEDKTIDEIYQAIIILMEREDVLSAGVNAVSKEDAFMAVPSDTYYSNQWALDVIDAESAWNLCKKAKDVNIVIIDSGIDATHPDIIDNISTNESVTVYNGVVTSTYPSDTFGHGTSVAGIIGAEGNNSTGVTGLCWETNLLSYSVFGNETFENVISAIDYAELHGNYLINLSMGFNVNDLTPVTYSAGYSRISNFTGLLVVAAGNSNNDIGVTGIYPASYHLSNMIVVGASSYSDTKETYSSYSSTLVDLFAPGGSVIPYPAYGVLSTYPISICSNHDPLTSIPDHCANGYHYRQGTSFAAPYVTATAALLMSYYSTMTPAQVRLAILNNVDTVSLLSGYCLTGGRLNVYAALSNP